MASLQVSQSRQTRLFRVAVTQDGHYISWVYLTRSQLHRLGKDLVTMAERNNSLKGRE